jgi:predicted RNase H-like HicB family nuclease
LNPESGTTTLGDNFSEALANLKEATELYLEVFPAPQKAASLIVEYACEGELMLNLIA